MLWILINVIGLAAINCSWCLDTEEKVTSKLLESDFGTLPVCISPSLYISPYLSLSLRLCLSVCVCLCVTLSVCVCLSVTLSPCACPLCSIAHDV